MPDRTVRLMLAAILLTPCAAGAAGRPAPARPCPENLPEGVRLPPQPGCGRAARDPDGRRGEDRFRDLGDGVSVRLNGRVGTEFGVRR